MINDEFDHQIFYDSHLAGEKIKKVDKYYDYSVAQGQAEPR